MGTENKVLSLESLYRMIQEQKATSDQLTGRIEAVEKEASKLSRGLTNIETEYPLLPPEADDLSKAVKIKGVEVMGGKKSAAYLDVALRRRVFQDIYGVVKREYGLIDEKGFQVSYKKLKRKHLKGAFDTVKHYTPSAALAEEIESTNEIGELDDM